MRKVCTPDLKMSFVKREVRPKCSSQNHPNITRGPLRLETQHVIELLFHYKKKHERGREQYAISSGQHGTASKPLTTEHNNTMMIMLMEKFTQASEKKRKPKMLIESVV